jgi:hypothetical protein
MRVDERQHRLLDQIGRAFGGVELGDGVSLHETSVIDEYGPTEERLAARMSDEKVDWRKLIDDPELPRLCGIEAAGLCFFDPTGLRFHLPACLSLAVRDPEGEGTSDMLESLLFQLTHLDEYNRKRLAILDNAQRTCVREVLVYLREILGAEDSELDRAIAGYWSHLAQA